MMLLDQGVFQQQGFLFGVGQHDIDIGDPGHQELDVVAGISGRREIRTDTLPEAARFADVDDRPRSVAHQVDAGGIRQLQ